MDAPPLGRGVLQNGHLSYIPRCSAANSQPLHTLFMQQALILECSPVGISTRRKQIGHLSLSDLSWPLVINRRSRFRAAARSADSSEPARTGGTALDMVSTGARSSSSCVTSSLATLNGLVGFLFVFEVVVFVVSSSSSVAVPGGPGGPPGRRAKGQAGPRPLRASCARTVCRRLGRTVMYWMGRTFRWGPRGTSFLSSVDSAAVGGSLTVISCSLVGP